MLFLYNIEEKILSLKLAGFLFIQSNVEFNLTEM